MVRHIVLLEFAEGADVPGVMTELGALRAELPDIKDFRWGRNSSAEGLSRGFNVVFEMDFDDRAALERYLVSPPHREVSESVLLPALKHGIDSVCVIDFAMTA